MTTVPEPTEASAAPAAPNLHAPEPTPPKIASDEPRGKLKRLALRASFFEMAGYGASQALRLGSNMILSRLLFPRAFGLMALVSIFNQGLIMLSDVGIEPAVIQSPHGDEQPYLNTAWTMQVLRGFILYSIAVLAAYPLAVLYKEPDLFALTCAGSFSVAISGLHSTSLYTLRRRLSVGRLMAIDLGSQIVAVLVMIPWALLHPSVWALVGGSLAAMSFKMLVSHATNVGYHNRFFWDRESKKAITNFGKWIFGASAVNFVGRQTDRLLLGVFLGIAELGVYSIAIYLAEALSTVTERLTHGILYPVLSRVQLQGTEALRGVYYRARLGLDALTLPALGGLTFLGSRVIHLLYDNRYGQAGWMLEALAVRVAMSCVLTPCETCLFSMGHTRFGLYQNIGRTLWVALAVPIGWHFGGLHGLVWAIALSELPGFVILWPVSRRLGALRFELELRALAFYAAGLLVGWPIRALWHI